MPDTSASQDQGASASPTALSAPALRASAPIAGAWVSVTDRLPPDGVLVVATSDGGHDYFEFDAIEDGSWIKRNEYLDHVAVIGGRTSDVASYTHWAALPPAVAHENSDWYSDYLRNALAAPARGIECASTTTEGRGPKGEEPGRNDAPKDGAEAVAAVAVPGAVWEYGGVSLIRRGAEDERCARHGAQRLHLLAAAPPSPQPATPTVEQINQELLESLKAHLRSFESQHALLLQLGAPDFVALRDKARTAIDAALTKKDEA